LKEGSEVTGLDIVPPNAAHLLQRDLLHPSFRYIWKSVQDIQPSDIDGHSVVAHLAAQPDTPLAFDSPRYTVMQNIGGTVELLEAVRHAGCIEKLIFAGSGNELGRPRYLPMDEDHPLTPHNPYGFTKAAAELAMWAWHYAYGVPSMVMSTGVVIGPHMRREVFIFKWLWNALQGNPIVVEGGEQTRDIAFIEDVAEAWTKAIKAPADEVVGEKIFVGSGRELSIARLADICRDAVGGGVPIEFTDYRPGEEGQRELFSAAKAKRLLGYAPRFTAEQSIAITADWVRSLLKPSPGKVEDIVNNP
jgi:UDP-glucose 4-epimerase